LNLTVTPRKRRAALWWNMNFTQLTDGGIPWKMEQDDRVEHESVPVEEGVKWGMNKWLHYRDFITNHKLGLLK